MSDEAINFKKENQNLDYKNMGLDELNKLPPHPGVIDFKITKTSFKMLKKKWCLNLFAIIILAIKNLGKLIRYLKIIYSL